MRTRANFGIVGPSQNVSISSSGGIYSSDDQQLSIKQNNWPKILFVTWSTASGLISTINDAGRGLISATVTATGSMGGATMAYSISSGSLPSGMTINNSGVISGTPSAVDRTSPEWRPTRHASAQTAPPNDAASAAPSSARPQAG